MAIKLKTTDWRDGSLRVYGERHTIHADAVGVGSVLLVYERDARRRTYRFVGVERVERNPYSEFAGDLPSVVKSLGSDAVSLPTWKKLYRADADRRAHYE